jgi:hypothetical protein
MITRLLTEYTHIIAAELFKKVPELSEIRFERTNMQYRSEADFTLPVFPLLKY